MGEATMRSMEERAGKDWLRSRHCCSPNGVRVGSGMEWLATQRLW